MLKKRYRTRRSSGSYEDYPIRQVETLLSVRLEFMLKLSPVIVYTAMKPATLAAIIPRALTGEQPSLVKLFNESDQSVCL